MRISLLSLFFLLFLSTALTAQDKRFRFGITVTPLVSDYFYTSDGTVPQGVEETIRDTDRPRIGFAGSLYGQYHLSEHWALLAGIGYSNTGNRTKKIDLFWPQPEPSLPQAARLQRVYHNLQAPVSLRRYFGNGATRFFAGLGAAPSYNFSNVQKTTIWYGNGRKERERETDNLTEFRSFNLNGQVQLGVERALTQRMRLVLQPVFDFTLLHIFENVPLNRRVFYWGLGAGVVFE